MGVGGTGMMLPGTGTWTNIPTGQVTLAGVLRVVVSRLAGSADAGVAQITAIAQQGRQLAIVELQELFQHQAGEQLRLRELLGAESMAIIRQAQTARQMRDDEHSPRRFGGLHKSIVTARPMLAGKENHGFSTEQDITDL